MAVVLTHTLTATVTATVTVTATHIMVKDAVTPTLPLPER